MCFVNEIIKYSTVIVCYWVDEKGTKTLVPTAQKDCFSFCQVSNRWESADIQFKINYLSKTSFHLETSLPSQPAQEEGLITNNESLPLEITAIVYLCVYVHTHISPKLMCYHN